MKKLIILLLLILFAVGFWFVCVKVLPMPSAAGVWAIVFISTSAFVYSYFRNQYLRKKWQECPILADSEEFDNFFWKLTLANQDWYIEYILKKEGVQMLLRRYETEVKQLWEDPELSQYQKTVESSVYLERIKLLSYALEFHCDLKS